MFDTLEEALPVIVMAAIAAAAAAVGGYFLYSYMKSRAPAGGDDA
jgi:hypothetical protein